MKSNVFDLFKRINKKSKIVLNFILVSIIYWVGGTLSFLLMKFSRIIESNKYNKKSYWIKTDSMENDNPKRQY